MTKINRSPFSTRTSMLNSQLTRLTRSTLTSAESSQLKRFPQRKKDQGNENSMQILFARSRSALIENIQESAFVIVIYIQHASFLFPVGRGCRVTRNNEGTKTSVICDAKKSQSYTGKKNLTSSKIQFTLHLKYRGKKGTPRKVT